MKRTLLWILVLLIGMGVGFGLGALTYEPPAPQFDVGSSPAVAPSLSPTAPSPAAQ
ncbi:MAG: hypothetical protein WD757_07775 [Actinomycetota bacterium]